MVVFAIKKNERGFWDLQSDDTSYIFPSPLRIEDLSSQSTAITWLSDHLTQCLRVQCFHFLFNGYATTFKIDPEDDVEVCVDSFGVGFLPMVKIHRIRTSDAQVMDVDLLQLINDICQG